MAGRARTGAAWGRRLPLALACLAVGVLLAAQYRTEQAVRQAVQGDAWEYVLADLVEGNARLREEVEALRAQRDALGDVEGGGRVFQSLVDEVNRLRMANGLAEVAGPGVLVLVAGPASVLDLQDLINELRNAGAEAIAINGQRVVAWSAISTDGQMLYLDGQPIQFPYHLEAIGEPHTLEVALVRPGGLVNLLRQATPDMAISVEPREHLILPVYNQPVEQFYVAPVD